MRGLLAGFLLIIAAAASAPAIAQNDVDANVASNELAISDDQTTSNELVTSNDQTTAEETEESEGAEPDVRDDNDPRVLAESGQTIVKLFVLAVLLESALALLFNWRPFLVYFDGRAVKPLVSFVAALIVVFAFELHTVADLISTYGGDAIPNDGLAVSRIIEAMVIAGGSSGVNTLLRGLGFRAIPSVEQEPKRPPENKAWLAIGLHRRQAVGPVLVDIVPTASPPIAGGTQGTIQGTMRRRGFLNFFLKDSGRYPTSQGMALEPGVEYEVRLRGKDANGADLPPVSEKITLGPRAIVDLEFTL